MSSVDMSRWLDRETLINQLMATGLTYREAVHVADDDFDNALDAIEHPMLHELWTDDVARETYLS